MAKHDTLRCRARYTVVLGGSECAVRMACGEAPQNLSAPTAVTQIVSDEPLWALEIEQFLQQSRRYLLDV